jgi:type IX secretion system PorP/SprF family membrane protein
MKKILSLMILFCAFGLTKAQNLTQYNHYIGNQGLLNPAYNGTRDVISGLVLHRSQWVGFEGAPFNEAINVHGPIEGKNMGLGIVIQNDHIGFTNTFDFFGAASYKLQIDKRRFLSLGLQLGLSSVVYDGTKAVTEEFGDPLFTGKYSKVNLNVGFGSYLYAEEYFIGLSIPKFFHNKFSTEAEFYKNTLNFKNMHTYLYGGYVFDWNDIKVKPTLLTKIVPGAPLEFDISTSVLLAEKVWVGVAYRTTSDLIFLTEYNIDRRFTVRYSFDYALSPLHNYAKFGSHELAVQFDFTFQKRPGMRSIRYF